MLLVCVKGCISLKASNSVVYWLEISEGTNTVRVGGGRGITGTIIDKDDESITVKLEDGSSKIVFLTSETTVNKVNTASTSDLKEESLVTINGLENEDGSMDAFSVQMVDE